MTYLDNTFFTQVLYLLHYIKSRLTIRHNKSNINKKKYYSVQYSEGVTPEF